MDQVGDANPQNGHSEDYQKLCDLGIDEKIAAELDELYQSGSLSHSDLDERALDALKEFNAVDGVAVVKEFSQADLAHVPNKSAYLCGVMKTVRTRKAKAGIDKEHKEPDEEKIKALLEKTGYDFEVTAGQRKYGGPPPGMDSMPPGSGHEVFCGRIPKDVYEDELVPLFEECGKIWDLRIMMDPIQNCSRGYCFVTYCEDSCAEDAVQKLDNKEIRPGKYLKVNASVANVRLFVGNIPKNKSKDDIQKEFEKVVQGLSEVIIYSNADDKKKNRGFAFLDFDSHKNAAVARKKLMHGRHRVWNNEVYVDWADRQDEPDEGTMSKVKVLYVRHLSADINEDKLKEVFGEYGELERVKKLKDYAFIHFTDRENALTAKETLNNTLIGKHEIEISLAKPMQDNKKKEIRRREQEKRHMYMMGRYSGYEDMWYQPPWRFPPPRGMRGGRFPPPPRGQHYYNEPIFDDEFIGYEDEFGGVLPPPRPLLPPRGRGRGPPRMPFRGGSSDRGMPRMLPPPMMGPRGLPPLPPPLMMRGRSGLLSRGSRGPIHGRGMAHGRGLPRGAMRGRGVPPPMLQDLGDVEMRPDIDISARSRGKSRASAAIPTLGRGKIITRVALSRQIKPAAKASKRKLTEVPSHAMGKQLKVGESTSEQTWQIQPIAQQPLNRMKSKQGSGTEQWYEDTFSAGW